MIRSMDVQADIKYLLLINPLEKWPGKETELEKWKFGLKRDSVLLIFYNRCLLINKSDHIRARQEYLVMR